MQLKPETNTLPGDNLPPPPLPNTIPDVSPYPVSPFWSDRARVMNIFLEMYARPTQEQRDSAISFWDTWRELTKPKG